MVLSIMTGTPKVRGAAVIMGITAYEFYRAETVLS
jgi:hypothetical protein